MGFNLGLFLFFQDGQICSKVFFNFVILAMSRERRNKVCCAETNSIILLSKRDLTSTYLILYIVHYSTYYKPTFLLMHRKWIKIVQYVQNLPETMRFVKKLYVPNVSLHVIPRLDNQQLPRAVCSTAVCTCSHYITIAAATQ